MYSISYIITYEGEPALHRSAELWLASFFFDWIIKLWKCRHLKRYSGDCGIVWSCWVGGGSSYTVWVSHKLIMWIVYARWKLIQLNFDFLCFYKDVFYRSFSICVHRVCRFRQRNRYIDVYKRDMGVFSPDMACNASVLILLLFFCVIKLFVVGYAVNL